MKFEVDTDQVNLAVGRLQSALNKVSGQKDGMLAAMRDLDSTWVGEAHDAFEVQYVADDEMMTDLVKSIQDVIDKVSKARGAYDSCEESVRGLAASIQI